MGIHNAACRLSLCLCFRITLVPIDSFTCQHTKKLLLDRDNKDVHNREASTYVEILSILE